MGAYFLEDCWKVAHQNAQLLILIFHKWKRELINLIWEASGRIDVVFQELAAFLNIVDPIILTFVFLNESEGVGIGGSWDVGGEGATVVVEEVEFDGDIELIEE